MSSIAPARRGFFVGLGDLCYQIAIAWGDVTDFGLRSFGWMFRRRAASSNLVSIFFQVGVRSAVLSIYVAMTALNDAQIALPAAVYSISMVLLGLSFGFWVRLSARNFAPAVALMKA